MPPTPATYDIAQAPWINGTARVPDTAISPYDRITTERRGRTGRCKDSAKVMRIAPTSRVVVYCAHAIMPDLPITCPLEIEVILSKQRLDITVGAAPRRARATTRPARTAFRVALELTHPITWFAAVWAYLCGAVASGRLHAPGSIPLILVGMILGGPGLTALSQVINDYCDRDVDAINEPGRPIPSGRAGLSLVRLEILALAGLVLLCTIILGSEHVGPYVLLGVLFALVYSAHPVRAKRNGWIGNALCAVSYEGLAWLAGNASFGHLTGASVCAALFYSTGAHGIMTINDFKSMVGDARLGIRTLPVLHGPRAAVLIAAAVMDLAQLGVIGLLAHFHLWISAAVVAALLVVQLPLQSRFYADPEGRAIWYNATGTTFFVWGMMATAIGIAHI